MYGDDENMNWMNIWTAEVWACEVKNCKLLKKNSFFAHERKKDLNTEKDSPQCQNPCDVISFDIYPKVVSGGNTHATNHRQNR